jgi:hypothetical protein
MAATKVWLSLDEDGSERIDVTQKPGIPYLLLAEDMGGLYYIVIDKDGNETIIDRDGLPFATK